jgi:hypothetical protein
VAIQFQFQLELVSRRARQPACEDETPAEIESGSEEFRAFFYKMSLINIILGHFLKVS